MKLPKVYEASDYESDIYRLWEDSGAFQPSDGKNSFSIVMPPPNATGRLHVGHAAMLAIEDTIVRYKRMKGYSVLWTPGTDHAGIATNAVVEKQLLEKGTTREDIGREKFLDEVHDFVEGSKDTIRSQIRAMGSSADWTRERYTMEPAMNRIVSEVFIKMYNDGLIYRGDRLINWDRVLQTAVSDDEIEYHEETTSFYTLKYGPFEIGTARPETKFGDKYVVMHPDDKRYQEYSHGQEIELEWINGPITATVIKDEAVDPEFGTGVMTITPWHDPVDFEIAERHYLEKEQIIDLDGKLMPIAGEFEGQSIEDARPKIVEKLKSKGLLVKTDDKYVHNVAISDRGKAIVEPQIMEQWFIDVNKPAVKWKGKKLSLKEVMQAVVNDGDIKIMPRRFEKIYFHWIDNLRDWNISRQIWWGHRIPAWFRPNEEGGHDIEVGYEQPEGDDWEQDPDTLDTWFSSALWTWSTLIEPDVALNEKYSLADMLKKSSDYKRFHPTDLMETGYDILFFWVARMILMTTYVTGDVPFKTVYLHGLVRSKDGSKMSKSKPESIIDPLDVIPKYGTDALRLSLLVGQAPGHDMRIFEEKIASYRNFCNKLWNIARFVESIVPDSYERTKATPKTAQDHWILSRLNAALIETETMIDAYEIGKAYEAVYHFIWDDLADWYIETSKINPNIDLLVEVFEATLKMTHPFAPFVSETIWSTLKWEETLLIQGGWPEAHKFDEKQVAEFHELMTIVSEVRHLIAQLHLTDSHLYHKGSEFLEKYQVLIIALTPLKSVSAVASGKGLNLTRTDIEAWLDVELQRAHQYIKKLEEKREKEADRVQTLKARLENKSYVANAPKELVEETKSQLVEAENMFDTLTVEINEFQGSIK